MTETKTIDAIKERLDNIKTIKHLHPHDQLMAVGDWRTPHTHTERYDKPEDRPGIYCFVGFKTERFIDPGTLLYIGSSNKIRTRYQSHNIPMVLNGAGYDYVQFYFMYCDDYLTREKGLIREFMPPFNSRIDG